MDRRDEWFSPENLEEQLGQHLSDVHQSSVNTRMLQDLERLSQDDVRRVASIRLRLNEHIADNTKRTPVPLHRYQNPPLQSPLPRDIHQMRTQPSLVVKLVSGLVAVLLITSMFGVLTWLRSHADQGKINSQSPVVIPSPLVNARGVFLLDTSSGKVLVDINSHAHLPVAGMAKIMTAVVAIENASLNKNITIEQVVLDEVPPKLRTARLQVGDQIPLRDLLSALLLPAGNDAALVIAHAFGNRTEDFVNMMNEEAHQLQLNDTHFSDPSGTSSDTTYSSAADLTRLASYAMQLSDFAQVVGQHTHELAATFSHHAYLWRNTTPLFSAYSGINGVLVINDAQAGTCAVFSAQRNDRLLIGAELHAQSSNQLISNVKKILETGFAQ